MFLIFWEKQFFKHLFHHHFIQICWNSLRNIGHTVDLLYKDALLLAKPEMLNFSKERLSCLFKKKSVRKTENLSEVYGPSLNRTVTMTVFNWAGMWQAALYCRGSTNAQLLRSWSWDQVDICIWIFLCLYCWLISAFNQSKPLKTLSENTLIRSGYDYVSVGYGEQSKEHAQILLHGPCHLT